MTTRKQKERRRLREEEEANRQTEEILANLRKPIERPEPKFRLFAGLEKKESEAFLYIAFQELRMLLTITALIFSGGHIIYGICKFFYSAAKGIYYDGNYMAGAIVCMILTFIMMPKVEYINFVDNLIDNKYKEFTSYETKMIKRYRRLGWFFYLCLVVFATWCNPEILFFL